LQDDWSDFYHKLEKMDLTGKTVALFGLGDSFIYPDSFVDAMGILYETVAEKGATLVGEVSPDGYQFDYSRALKNGVFVGLPLDEDNDADLTNGRIEKWVESLKKHLD
ncbi:MAG TPA: flavodoxin, partial [Porphyromonadaceae bacterium]|nr:flavodoxin [Porphyromonadaceae bacterium]HCB89959.1 flavodoxin [Porphyromonadaceae bacterium]